MYVVRVTQKAFSAIILDTVDLCMAPELIFLILALNNIWTVITIIVSWKHDDLLVI